MSAGKKEIRRAFRTTCLTRDKYKYRICNVSGYDRNGEEDDRKKERSANGKMSGTVPLDVHHITERNQDNYVRENGISVCGERHLKCEKFHITNGAEWVEGLHPNDLYIIIKSTWRI